MLEAWSGKGGLLVLRRVAAGGRTRGRRLAVPYSHQTAPTVTQQPPCYFFVKNYTFKVSFASLKSIFLEKDLRESVKLTKNLYYSRFFTSKMEK